jgi:predicted phosphodiesterase
MRLAVLSDIHGNLPALEAVLADIGRRGQFDELVVGGDLVWGGAWPGEVVDLVRSYKPHVILGNTELFLQGELPEEMHGAEAQRAWLCEQLGAERKAFLLGLPFSWSVQGGAEELRVVHANPHDLDRPITPQADSEKLAAILGPEVDAPWKVLAFGHYHVPFQRVWAGRLLVDVASVGMPMDGDRRAAYAILTWDGSWHAEHMRVPYDLPAVIQKLRTSGMPSAARISDRLARATYAY